MNRLAQSLATSKGRIGWLACLLAAVIATPVFGQDDPAAEADRRFQEAFSEPAAAPEPEAAEPTADAAPALVPSTQAEINLFELLVKGGYLMIPIGIMSIVVMVFAVERAIGMRKSRVLPADFVQGLGKLAKSGGGLDPRLAYRLCQLHKCTASNVVKAALLKLGRPHTEVEKAVSEAKQREADALYQNVRPIALAMAVTPLMGLLGTVWGMMETFFVVSQAEGGVKVADLAGGIYVALVTTVAGLAVAIPAAFLAHYFEGRIQRVFRQIDDLIQSIMPQLERYEGKLRVTAEVPTGRPPEPPPVQTHPGSKPPPVVASRHE
jgi:biopolymer transport protein ExbB